MWPECGSWCMIFMPLRRRPPVAGGIMFWGCLLSVRPSVLFLWTRYLKNGLRGFLQICFKYSVGLKDGPLKAHFLPCECNISQSMFMSFLNMISQDQVVPFDSKMNWLVLGGQKSQWPYMNLWEKSTCSGFVKYAILSLNISWISNLIWLDLFFHPTDLTSRP